MMAYEGHRNFFIICPGKSTLSVDCFLADSEPDFIEVFGETGDQVSDWSHEASAEYKVL